MERSARREQVLGCAVRVFSERGYHATTVSDIIDDAGVARGTFYLYFKSKRAIFDELLDQFLERILEQIERVDTDEGAASPLAQMQGNVERVLDVLLGHREMARILLRQAVGLDADFDRKLEEFYVRLAERIESALRSGQEMGLIAPVDVRVASLCVLGSVKEVVDHLVTSPDALPERAVLAEAMLEVFLGGLFVSDVRSDSEDDQ